MKRLILLLLVCAVFTPVARAQSCDVNATTTTFGFLVSVAQPGQTLCLASGNYGTFRGVTKTSPAVTIRPGPGATPTMALQLAQPSPVAAWLTFDGITISGIDLAAPANNITIKNATVTGKAVVWGKANNNFCGNCPAMNNQNIVFDNVLFDLSAFPSGGGGFEGRIQLTDGGSTPQGVIIKNSRFAGGCADGIQISGDNAGFGVTIGPGNEFDHLQQGDCDAHVDAIQFVGTGPIGPEITGNYFHDNSNGIVGWDYGNNAMIRNNVIRTTDQQFIDVALDTNSIVEHNTLVGGQIFCGRSHQGQICRAIIRNNIASNIITWNGDGTGSPVFNDYNLCTSDLCAGPNSLSGSPTYVGGVNATSYAGFAMAATSLGHAAGNDHKDIGIDATQSQTEKPKPPTGVMVQLVQ